jgi:toxin ParE1/3/4
MTPSGIANVIWSESALNDLESIQQYLTEQAPRNAADFCLRLLQSTKKLEQFPDLGSQLDINYDPPIRQIFFPPFRIIYQHQGAIVSIIRVYHFKRHLSSSTYFIE